MCVCAACLGACVCAPFAPSKWRRSASCGARTTAVTQGASARHCQLCRCTFEGAETKITEKGTEKEKEIERRMYVGRTCTSLSAGFSSLAQLYARCASCHLQPACSSKQHFVISCRVIQAMVKASSCLHPDMMLHPCRASFLAQLYARCAHCHLQQASCLYLFVARTNKSAGTNHM